jgi:hypothetical protein
MEAHVVVSGRCFRVLEFIRGTYTYYEREQICFQDYLSLDIVACTAVAMQ